MSVEQSDPASAIPEENQVFTQNAGGPRQVLEVRGETYGVPETAQVLAARRPRPDLG
jgi:hypothetical protein